MARSGPMASPFRMRFPAPKAPIPGGVHLSDQPVCAVFSDGMYLRFPLEPVSEQTFCRSRSPSVAAREERGEAPLFPR